MEAIAAKPPGLPLAEGFVAAVRAWLTGCSATPTQAVLLLPDARLAASVQACWAASAGDGFAPRVTTTAEWARQEMAWVPGELDLRFERPLDGLTARVLLQRAGLQTGPAELAARLVDLAWTLAEVARAVPPPDRPAWAAALRPFIGAGLDQPLLALEAALASLALAWAADSSYPTDVLHGIVRQRADLHLAWLDGPLPDPLARALLQRRPAPQTLIWSPPPPSSSIARVRRHQALDPEDEAQRAAACVLQAVRAGRRPVALVALDRQLVRRVQALLSECAVAVRDETGWRLSTTRAAAAAFVWLRASRRDAGTDAVLDALQHSPAVGPDDLAALERRLCALGRSRWAEACAALGSEHAALVQRVERLRVALAHPRSWLQWCHDWRATLEQVGQWEHLCADSAGQQVLSALALDNPGRWRPWPSARFRMDLAGFMAWATDALEAARFRPPEPPAPDVVVLPMEYLPGRLWGAVVIPGCDAAHLPAMPATDGWLSPAQRQALGLPSPEQQRQARALVWQQALSCAEQVDVLHRRVDGQGRAVLPSPLLQALVLDGGACEARDPRHSRHLEAKPVAPPAPVAAAMARMPARLTASSYEDLRACPYRFFALRLLGLRRVEDIDADMLAEPSEQAASWGRWVHGCLEWFHRHRSEPATAASDAMAMDAAEAQVARSLMLTPVQALTVRAAWPALRAEYLRWLQTHESAGARFEHAELSLQRQFPGLHLSGRIDRVDRMPDGSPLLIDYKTGSEKSVKDRLARTGEDTQLPFYALLVDAPAPEAAYLHLGSDTVTLHKLADVGEARDALLAGMQHDMGAIAAGASLRPLGEGRLCERCEVRGLCRKDDWAPPARARTAQGASADAGGKEGEGEGDGA